MGKIIIALLIIIVLILIAPGVLALLGLLFAALIGALIKFWWLILIIIVIIIALPSLLKTAEKTIENTKRISSKKKYYIFSSSALFCLIIIIGVLVNNKTFMTYPVMLDLTKPENYGKIKDAEIKLYNDRGENKNDTIPFGKFVFGMTKEDVLAHVRKNKISEEIVFDDYTYSKISMLDSLYETAIKYEFDKNNRLRAVNIEYVKKQDNKDFVEELKKVFGDKYIDKEGYGYNPEINWFKGNQKITLSGRYSRPNCHYDLIFKDDNYHGVLNSKPIYSPIQKLRNVELKKINGSPKSKLSTFMGFQLGMTKQEVQAREKELIAELIKNNNYCPYEQYNSQVELGSFIFEINKKNNVLIKNIDFAYFENKLYFLKVDYSPDDKIYGEFLKLYLTKYGDYNIKLRNKFSNEKFCWIKDGMEVRFSWGEISYFDIYQLNQNLILKRKTRNANKEREVTQQRIKELEIQKERKIKEDRIKNQKNNI